MPRIAGVNIPENKRLIVGLSYIFGIGPNLAQRIVERVNLEKNPRVSELTEAQLDRLRGLIEKELVVETDLKQRINQNIRRLKEIGAYRGIRHTKKLPVHGQRTRTNARTKRGRRVTVGSGRKKPAEKT